MDYIQRKLQNSPTITAITCKDGLVIFTEKTLGHIKKNFENRSNMVFLNKINLLAGTGLSQDFQRIIERAKVDSSAYREKFSSILTGKILAARISSLVHLQTRYWHIRPLCCSLFLASMSINMPKLFIITHNGYFFNCFSGSLGEKSEMFRATIEKLLEGSVKCRKSIEKIYKLYKNAKKNFNFNYLEIACFSQDNLPFKIPISCNILLEANRKAEFD